ncbi:MAG TPA: sulfatase-like hydrolase/transferase [Vicinamibacteria bacterium]|nr:sulfatase-like hydrolase/transferase [Vicinamibacteria bacterium]
MRARSRLTTGVAGALLVMACLAAVLVYRTRPPRLHGSTPIRAASTAARALPGGVRSPSLAAVPGSRFVGANVVVITIDTLRRDHLAPYGASFETPAATRLAREGVLFEHAVSHVPLTLPSHSTIFTGLYPPHHGVRDNAGFALGKDVTTLAERLLARGYQTAAVVGSYVLAARWGLAKGHQTYDDSFDYSDIERRALTEIERPANRVVDRAVDWLRRERRGDRPFYLWVHLYDPHDPYTPPDEYRRRAPSAYAGEVMFADAEVNRLLDTLDALGLRRNTTVVYLSDHGESLGEHGEAGHGIFLYGATLDVPMLIAPPTGTPSPAAGLLPAGRRVRGLARLVDVTPTVLDLVGLPPPAGLDGASLLPLVAHDDALDDPPDALAGPVSYAETWFPRFHHGWSELTALETGRWKSIRAPKPELYDRRRDPRELENVHDQRQDVVATLSAELRAMNLLKAGGEPKPGRIDPEALEKLRALGYVGAGSDGRPVELRSGPLPDAKDRVGSLQELQKAQALKDAGRLDEATPILEKLAREDPANPDVPLTLASVYFQKKNYEAAIAAGRRVLELNPRYAVAVLDLALSYQAAGRIDEAIAGFEHTLELLPDNVKALLSLAEIHYARGERQKAFDCYQHAARVVPTLWLAHLNLGTLALEMKRYEVAEAELRQALALGANRPSLHFNLGVIAEQRRQPAVAVREYRAEVAAYPDAYKAWVNLGLLERQAGRVDAALAAFEKAAAARADDMAGPYLLAETLAARGRRAEADRWAQEALRRSPGDPRAQQLAQRLHALR